jgi:hypothetical protein
MGVEYKPQKMIKVTRPQSGFFIFGSMKKVIDFSIEI